MKGGTNMKKIRMLALLLLATVLLTACGGGNVRHVKREMGESALYSQGEIRAAMNEVVGFFRKEFDGCILTGLEYDEGRMGERQQMEAEELGREVIILLAEFRVDGSGGDGSLNPNSTYRNYQFTLTRTLLGWEIRDWGYG